VWGAFGVERDGGGGGGRQWCCLRGRGGDVSGEVFRDM